MEPSAPKQTPIGRVVALGVGLGLIVGVLTLAFAWPSAGMGPNEIPIAVIGPEEAAEGVQDQLDEAEPDGFDVTTVADVHEAETLIEEREVYGAFQITPDSVTLYSASAASPTVARLLTGIADQIADGVSQAAGQPGSVQAQVEDVVALPSDDPNGAALAAAGFPLTIGSLVIAALIGFTMRGTGRQILAAVIAPIGAGAAITGVLMYVLGTIDGDYFAVSGAIAFAIAAASWTILGLIKLLGPVGMGIGAVTMMLVGNPLSGLTSAPELLPEPWGAFGQFLPPGAGATLLRSSAYFEVNGAETAMLTLAAWLAAGAVLFTLGAVRAKVKSVHAEEREAASAAA